MPRYTKTQVTQLSANEQAAINNINKNFDDIETAIKDTVSRSGSTPTHMTEDLDMNGKRIINLPAPKTDTDPVRRQDVVNDIALVQSLVNATTNAAAQTLQAAADVQEIIQDANVGLVADDLALGDDSTIHITANNIDDVNTVANNIEDISSVVDNAANISAVADNETNINAVNSNKTNIDTVASNNSNITTVAGISSDVTTVAGNTSNINSVVSNETNINTCANNMSAITSAPTYASSASDSADAAALSAQQSAISAAACTPILLDFKWVDHEINNMAWLRADTFSWQDGTVYTDAYNHLASDYNGGTSQTETVGSYTITYVLATDGHKITTDETTVLNIYNESGVAWYYILDTTNERFKLPRTKYGFVGLRDVVGKYVPAGLPNITGGFTSDVWPNPPEQTGAFKRTNLGHNIGGRSSGTLTSDGNSVLVEFDASDSNSIYGNSITVQPPATQMYLYFYVGQFSQTATEQTAGLNAELFNGKADVDLNNVSAGIDFVVESYKNGTEWYRLYKSGWVEQGGLKTASGTSGSVTISLLKEMANTNYNILITTQQESSVGNGGGSVKRATLSVSSFDYGWVSMGLTGIYWEVKGMSAQ